MLRCLGIETATRRGSVALVEDGRLIARGEHVEPNAHAERILPLVARVLGEAGWTRSSLDRLGVGIGPGSFVGLRVGIALAEGLSLGLDRPLVGVSSLAAMARAVPEAELGPRVALLDARRGEVFLGVFSAAGATLVAPRAEPRDTLSAFLQTLDPASVVVGEIAAELALVPRWLRGAELDLPDAAQVAARAAELDPASAPARPEYVRDAGAALPNLPPSPFATRPSS